MALTDYAFEELNEGSGRGTIPDDGQKPHFQRCFKIAWTDLGNFLFELKGGWQKLSDTLWQYHIPSQHPDWPGVFCAAADYEGIGLTSQDGTTKRGSWEYAKVTATYRTFPYDPGNVDPSTLVAEEFDTSLDIIPLPNGSLTTATGVAIDTPANLIVPTLGYTVKMPQLPTLPGGSINVVMALLGRMNSSGFGGAVAGHMLFLGMKASRKGAAILAPDGSALWDVELKFVYRDQYKWNEIYVPAQTGWAGGWTAVKFADSGAPLYESGNLRVLLPNGA